MMLELHNVTIEPHIHDLSLTVADGQLVCLAAEKGRGKTTLLRALLGFVAINGGHISIDGELLTPQSAPYFRRIMAYVPQHLSLPDGYSAVKTDYLWLLRRAVESGKSLLFVDEPAVALSDEDNMEVDRLLEEASQRGMTVLAVNSRITPNQVRL